MFTDALVNLYTKDIDLSLHFYGATLGFTETFRTPREGTPTHVELTVGGFTLGLSTIEAAASVHGIDALPGNPAMSIVVWTDDLDAAVERLLADGAPLLQPPHSSGNDNRSALLRDPDGNLVELVTKVA